MPFFRSTIQTPPLLEQLFSNAPDITNSKIIIRKMTNWIHEKKKKEGVSGVEYIQIFIA